MGIREEQLSNWAKPLTDTEEEKCQNAIRQITQCMRDNFGNDVTIYLQGSHRNRTNVKRDSDVDIVVQHTGYYFGDTINMTDVEKQAFFEIPSSEYTFKDLKDEVEKILAVKFGVNVERKNKCIRVNGNSSRVNADVIPCFTHKRLITVNTSEAEGIQFYTDDGSKVISFPNQHYENGVNKNTDTSRMYKAVVRILKNIRNNLIDEGQIKEDLMSSYFLECLVWNLADSIFKTPTYTHALNQSIQTLWKELGDGTAVNTYAEVSNLHWLFRGQERKPDTAKTFIQAAYNYLY